jgi:hypothetical protein
MMFKPFRTAALRRRATSGGFAAEELPRELVSFMIFGKFAVWIKSEGASTWPASSDPILACFSATSALYYRIANKSKINWVRCFTNAIAGWYPSVALIVIRCSSLRLGVPLRSHATTYFRH